MFTMLCRLEEKSLRIRLVIFQTKRCIGSHVTVAVMVDGVKIGKQIYLTTSNNKEWKLNLTSLQDVFANTFQMFYFLSFGECFEVFFVSKSVLY